MNYTQRMLIIASAIFGKELDATFLKSVMMAFAEGMPVEGLSEAEIAEGICRQWIESARAEMLETVRAYNRQIAVVAADTETNRQLQVLR